VARRPFSSVFAQLASAIPLFRPGEGLPGANAPYAAAPLTGTRQRESRVAKVRRSLRASCAEGMLAEVFTACAGGAVLTGWALHLRLSPFLVGILGALPFLAQLVQFPAAAITSWLGHRRAAIWAVMLSREVYLPLALLPFLKLSLLAEQRLLVAIAALAAVLGIIGNNAWVAWMGELVPARLRGRYFGRRTALCILGGSIAQLVAGAGLDAAKRHGVVGPAFSVAALVACAVGGLTTWLMSQQHDPVAASERVPFAWAHMLRPLREEGARRVMAYQLTWNAAIGIASVFFSVHMLKNLKMGFLLIALYNAGVAGIRILVAPLWGRALDRVGVRPILVACCFGMSLVPLLWLLPTPGRLWPLGIDFVLSGVLWCGQSLADFQLPLRLAPREGRPYYLAAFMTAEGIAFAIASAAGGAIAEALPPQFVLAGHPFYAIHVLFVLSAVGRFATALVAMRLLEPTARPLLELLDLVREGVSARLRPVRERAPVGR
jgi:MFS family permease